MKCIRLNFLAATGAALAVLLLVACAGKSQTQSSSFDKWKKMAEQSRGYSPTSRDRSVAIPPKKIKRIAPGQIEAPPARPLPQRKVTMKMHETDVAILLRALARSVNLNIMINESVHGRISINVKDAKWDQIFKGILNSQGLTYEWEGDILRIVTLDDINRRLMQLEAKEKIQAKTRQMERQAPLVTKIIPIDFSKADKLKENVEKMLTTQSTGESIGSVLVDSHTNALIVQATPTDIERIVPLITELDRPTAQVLIEAHIVETTNQTARELGVQWGGLYKNGDYWFTADPTSDISGITPGSGGVVDPAAGIASNFPANLGNASQVGTGLSIGMIGDFGTNILAVQLTALEEEGKLNILSSPSITTLDNVKATIESGNEIPIQVVQDRNVGIVYKTAVLSLEVTPHVIQDNVLKLEIFTSKDEVGVLSQVNQNPTIITKRANTNVILFDGQTTVIGGLKKNTDQQSESGIPWIYKIPGLGYLFKNEGRSHQMEELLIFITPHILKTRPASFETPGQSTSPAD